MAEDRNRLPEAIRSLERASAYWRENPRVFNNLAIAYWQSDKIDDAISAFLQAIKLQPDNPEFIQNVVQLMVNGVDGPMHFRMLAQWRLLPDNPQVQAFLAQIERNAQAQ